MSFFLFIFALYYLYIPFFACNYPTELHKLLQRYTSSPSNNYTGAQQVHTGDSYATRAITEAHNFTRHFALGHNRPNEPRRVNHKMVSQGHYMETFIFLLMLYFSIDLFNFL